MAAMRRYGQKGRPVFVLHGGPGAPGSAAGLAEALGDSFRVFEPLQRLSSNVPLTVAQHVSDLSDAISGAAFDEKPAIVGHSWGAMLALVFAAEYPERVSAVVLVGSGTFDRESRAEYQRLRRERMTDELRARVEEISARAPNENERRARVHAAMDSMETVNRIGEVPLLSVDAKGNRETWEDMLQLLESGMYPAAFSAIRCPVLMLHGAYDPHPGELIRRSLVAHMPRLEYREFEQCGHEPWVERYARDEFLRVLRAWLSA